MANIAYVRVSTIEQNPKRQQEALKKHHIDKWFIEKLSGKNTDRPQLKLMLDYARENDTIYIESFSRLARNTKDLLNIIENLNSNNIQVISIKENLDTSTPTGKLMLTMIGAISTFEREIMLERQKEGIAIAKQEGKYKGRTKKEKPELWTQYKEEYYTRKINLVQLAKKCNVSRPIIYKWLQEDKE